MPARETVDGQPDAVAGDDEMALFDDDKAFLASRIERLRSPLAHAERPPSRLRYFVSNVEIDDLGQGQIDVSCNILVYQSRLERTEASYVGRREDRLRRHDQTWRIKNRKIVLDQTLIPRAFAPERQGQLIRGRSQGLTRATFNCSHPILGTLFRPGDPLIRPPTGKPDAS